MKERLSEEAKEKFRKCNTTKTLVLYFIFVKMAALHNFVFLFGFFIFFFSFFFFCVPFLLLSSTKNRKRTKLIGFVSYARKITLFADRFHKLQKSIRICAQQMWGCVVKEERHKWFAIYLRLVMRDFMQRRLARANQ
jgi:hypothetical protein